MALTQTLPTIPLVNAQRTATSSERLSLSNADLTAAISAAGPTATLPAIILAHALTTLRLAFAGVRYLCQGDAVAESYRRMTTAEFALINARQEWANWRTIPRNLTGHLPVDRPLTVVDLCCGMGDSTCVLAWWLPAGSRIIGLELDTRFAAAAARRTYRNRHGDIIPTTIHRASVLETFRDHAGQRCAAGSVDLVHAIGSIGCHFSPDDSRVIVRECARVLAADGFALLDAGNAGTPPSALAAIAGDHGLTVVRRSRSWWFDRYVQLVLRRAA